MGRIPLVVIPMLCLVIAGGAHPAPTAATSLRSAPLRLEHVGADSTGFHVIATLIAGPTELIVWDAQYHRRDANRLADRIAATGKRLKAIVLSHPDHDHYMGVATVLARFPGTPVYLSAAGIAEFAKTGAQWLEMERRGPLAKEAPDSLVMPQALPPGGLTVDGQALEILPDLIGDSGIPANSVLWIPSLRAALVADLAFDGVHPWLGASSEASRQAWIAAIDRVLALRPAVVVPGHKRNVDAPDSPDVLRFTQGYLRDFDALRKTSAGPEALVAAMTAKYPGLAVADLLRFGAQMAFRPPRGKSE